MVTSGLNPETIDKYRQVSTPIPANNYNAKRNSTQQSMALSILLNTAHDNKPNHNYTMGHNSKHGSLSVKT